MALGVDLLLHSWLDARLLVGAWHARRGLNSVACPQPVPERPFAPARPRHLQALLAEAAALLEGLEGGLPEQPPRLQRKHAAITQYATAMRQPQG